MGSKYLEIEKVAEKLGFKDFPVTILYGQPQSIKTYRSGSDDIFQLFGMYKSSGIITDTARIITKLLDKDYQLYPSRLKKISDPSEKPRFFHGYGMDKRVHKYYFLAPTKNLYIELNNKVKEPARRSMKRHGFQLKIYSSDPEHKFKIAEAINTSYIGGFLSQISNWDRIEQFFDVNPEDCIRDWNKIIQHSI
jgi:hypothetical protein